MSVLTAHPNDQCHRRKKYSAPKALHSLISSKENRISFFFSLFLFLFLFLFFFFGGEGGVACIIKRNLQCNFISKKTLLFNSKQWLERCSEKRTRNFALRHFTPTLTVFMNYKISHSHQSDLFLKGFKIDSLGYVCLI